MLTLLDFCSEGSFLKTFLLDKLKTKSTNAYSIGITLNNNLK